jgi:uncharacterized peroxidase-related enzyme
MTYIRVIRASHATGELAELYRVLAYPDGSVADAYVALSLNPPLLRADAELYRVTMYATPGLGRIEREMIAVLVSALHGCRRCVAHHGATLRRLLPPDKAEVADRLADGASPPSLTVRERAVLELARALTTSPGTFGRAEVDAARRAGLGDEELLDAVNVASYFAYANRMTLGLGIGEEEQVDQGMPPANGAR